MRSTLREQVLRLLALEPSGLPAPVIARRVRPRVSQPTLWRTLDGLRSEGRITVEGRGRATRYHAASRTHAAALRSLRLHQCAARRLAADPALRALVRDRLRKLREVNPHGRVYHDQWAALLDGPLPALLRTMTEVSEQAEALRKESPFTILVTPAERRRAFDNVRAG
jgi:Fe2+ or Zn2+ uptake regulation protein